MAVRGITKEQLQEINAMYLAKGKKAAKELEKSIRFKNKMKKLGFCDDCENPNHLCVCENN